MPFRDIVGHRAVLTLLRRGVAQRSLPPALLLAGPSGVGKRTMAVALAQALNCGTPAGAAETLDACGECLSCRRIARGVHPDVVMVQPGENGSIKIEQVRDVIDRAQYRPFEGRVRVVIIDEADAAGDDAQSALLKTLEEPPSSSMFVLVSSMPDALLATVRSRCPRLRIGPLATAEVVEALMRLHEYDEPAARAAAADADGSIGRALEAESADLVEARESAWRVLEQATRQRDPAGRVALARELLSSKGSSAEERSQLAACLRAAGSLLRDAGLLAAGADRRVLANRDLESGLEGLSRFFDAHRSVQAHAAVDRALAALERNASPKIVADWVVLQL